MTTADRTLTALVLGLLLSAPLVRPAWRAIDPGPADFLRACASLRAREPMDPWGSPWVRTPWNPGLGPPFVAPNPRPVPTIFEAGSAGPDRSVGTADDMPMIWWENRDQQGGFRWVPESGIEASPETRGEPGPTAARLRSRSLSR